VINGTNILLDGSIDIANTDKFIAQPEFESRYRHFAIGEGDIVLSSSGTLGKVGRITGDHLPLMMNTSVIRFHTKDSSLLDDDYLFAFLRSPDFQSLIRSFAVGGAQQNFGPSHLKQIHIPLPPIITQRRVASTISAYDNLIENNRRRMALLEQVTPLLYREWFVRLRFPGHEHTLLLNGTPAGWERRPLGGCAKFLSGGTPSKATSEFWDGDIPWVSSGELTTIRIHDSSLHVTAEAIDAGSRLVPPYTILDVVRGKSLAKEFRMAMTSQPVAFNQDLKSLVPQSDVDAVYLFHALEAQREQIRGRATEASHGTKKLDTQALASVPILVPPVRIQDHFREIVEPLNAQWDVLERQTEQLRAARDLLLPRLMRGEIAI
jgi:type I restriction enzyme S subunit